MEVPDFTSHGLFRLAAVVAILLSSMARLIVLLPKSLVVRISLSQIEHHLICPK